MEWLGSGSEDDDDEDDDGDDDDDDEDGMETDWYHPAGASATSSKIHAESIFLSFWNFFFRVLLIGPGSMKSLTKYKYPVKDLVW